MGRLLVNVAHLPSVDVLQRDIVIAICSLGCSLKGEAAELI